MSVTVHHADNREVLATLPDNSIDAVVTDPPYALVSIQKRLGKPGAAPAKGDVYARASAGFMGKQWDTGEVAFAEEFWAQVWRVLKPGGHLVAFSGTRTYHRMVVAIEDAGFEIRDQLAWVYGSGFPKSHDVAKGIDKHLGFERAKVRVRAPKNPPNLVGGIGKGGSRPWVEKALEQGFHEAASPEAASWSGYGTALKPSWEPICLARKPLDGTVAENVLRWGVGALNIDGCRVAHSEECRSMAPSQANIANPSEKHRQAGRRQETLELKPSGRWPANVLHDGSDEVVGAFPERDGATSNSRSGVGGIAAEGLGPATQTAGRGDTGSAARFFYAAEPDDLCGLCGCPCGSRSDKFSPCDANTAELSSPTENTLIAATAPSGAAASPRRERGGTTRPLSGPARDAGSPSSPPHRMDSDIADGPAQTPPPSSLVQSVRSAGNLCASCATAIAQSLVATRLGQNAELQPSPVSISERSAQILRQHLALYVEGREGTDTILTTPSLKQLLGSVFHAIAESTLTTEERPSASSEKSKRLWYGSKADATDRLGSKHPTVKPVDLMAWLVRMVCPPGGVVLDPFAGSGTTGLAAMREGRDCVLIEREDEYVADINRRIAWANGEGKLTAQEKASDANPEQLRGEDLPLFATQETRSQPASQPASQRRRIGPIGMKR